MLLHRSLYCSYN